MKKITTILSVLLLSATSMFAQTTQFVSLGTAYNTTTKNLYNAEIGCKTKNVWYSIIAEFRNSDTTGVYYTNSIEKNDLGQYVNVTNKLSVPKLVLGGKVQKQIKALSQKSSLNLFTVAKVGRYGVANQSDKATYVQVEPGLSLMFDLTSHLALQSTLSTFTTNSFALNQNWPVKFGVGLTWIK
jgi:hypothetical protein